MDPKKSMKHKPSLLRILSIRNNNSQKRSDLEFRKKSIKRYDNNISQYGNGIRLASSFDYGIDNIANDITINSVSDANDIGYQSISPGYTYSNGISPTHESSRHKHEDGSRKAKEDVEMFCKKTTAHGWGRVIQEKLYVIKGFWLVLTILAYICNALHVTLLVQQYLSYPSEQISRVELQSIEFPSVTVCNIQPMSFSTGLERISNSSSRLYYWTKLTDQYFNSPAVENMTEERKEYLYNRVRQPIGYFENLGDEYREIGHMPRDFILRCTFASKDCIADNFTYFTSPTYFNCYTFNGGNTSRTKLETRSTGPQQGLSLILYLESDNGDMLHNGTYHTLSNVANAAGARVLIHPPDTRPSPVDQGFDIPPGYSSSIGLKVSEYTRLGEPYGKCVEETYFNSDQYIYSSHDCLMQCQQSYVMDNCGCISASLPVPENPYNLTYCGKFNPDAPQYFFENLSCEAAELEKFSRNEKMRDICGCYPPCMELAYSGDVSYSYWPLDFAQQSFYQSYVLRHSMKDSLKAYTNLKHFELSELINKNLIRKNFIRLNVFLQDLVINEIIQKTTYELQNLLSDMGGTFGLWIGVSILSWFEIAELLSIVSFKGVRFIHRRLGGERVGVNAWDDNIQRNGH